MLKSNCKLKKQRPTEGEWSGPDPKGPHSRPDQWEDEDPGKKRGGSELHRAWGCEQLVDWVAGWKGLLQGGGRQGNGEFEAPLRHAEIWAAVTILQYTALYFNTFKIKRILKVHFF